MAPSGIHGEITWSLEDGAGVPEGDWWLTVTERAAQQRFTVPKRRSDWRLGRWAAKNLLGATARLPPGRIGILARSDVDGFPCVEGIDDPTPQVSISHCDGLAVAAAAPAGIAIGCDLERIERRPGHFAADWFTPGENRRLESLDPALRDKSVTLIWSVKEAALKAIGEGLRMDTRDVEAEFHAPPEEPESGGSDPRAWVRVSATIAGGRRFDGWSRTLAGSRFDHLVVLLSSTGSMELPPRLIEPQDRIHLPVGDSSANGDDRNYCSESGKPAGIPEPGCRHDPAAASMRPRDVRAGTPQVLKPNNPNGGHQK